MFKLKRTCNFAEIITLRAIALKQIFRTLKTSIRRGRDHNATSYSTETELDTGEGKSVTSSRDHNATSYSTETRHVEAQELPPSAEIITLRAIALKHCHRGGFFFRFEAEIITLRAIALKLEDAANLDECLLAEIITLRAIALKPFVDASTNIGVNGRDHNATSYSTETVGRALRTASRCRRDHNATSYSTETVPKGRFTETGCRQQRS